MLIELLLGATAETTPDLRRLGLVGDSVALWSRATRQRHAWADHEALCHEVVARSVAGLAQRRRALVLGSGLLRDVPIDLLAASFDEVVLVDAVHLRPARRRARRPNVVRRVVDLTGCAAWLHGAREGRDVPLATFRADPDIDLVVSANLLSQLPMAVERWLERRPARRAVLPADLPSRIVGWHLQDLAALDARVCLLTDVELREDGPDGVTAERTDLLRGHVLPPPDAAWDWPVAPRGEADRRLAHVHRVHGYADLFRLTGLAADPRAGEAGRPQPVATSISS